MFWLMRCALAIGVLYWFSPLRGPHASGAPDWRALEGRWRDESDKLRGLALETAGRDAALGALSALHRSSTARDTRPLKP